MDIVRKELSADELTTPGTRYNPDTDTVQQLVNGVWMDNPSADPRTSSAFLYPPLTTSDPACDASANMVAALRHIVSEAVSAGSLVAMASLIYQAIAAVFPPLLIFDPLVLVICDVIIGLTTTVVNGAFTDSVYADILCYFKGVVDSDGQLDATGLESVRTQITDHQDAVVAAVCDAVFALVGWVGVNNWGASGTETGDCDGCAGWCYEWDFTLSDGGWTIGEAGSYSSGVGYVGTFFDAGNNTDVLITKTIPTTAGSTLTRIRLFGSRSAASGSNANIGLGVVEFGDGFVVGGRTFPGATGSFNLILDGTRANTANDILYCQLNQGTSGGSGIITKIKASGTGTNPFGTDNCT